MAAATESILGRLALLAALLSILASIPECSAANITRFANVTASVSCPDNILLMNMTASDGSPAPDVELRLVLYLPYFGLRALQHTNSSGLATVQLTRTGSYRIYIDTDAYNHDKYVEFEYPEFCPPPPPNEMEINVTPACDIGKTRVFAKSNGSALQDVFITFGNWSSLTGSAGEASFPLEEGSVWIRAEKANYTTREFFAQVSCAPPPECLADSDCAQIAYCSAGNCTNVTGECGYPENHSWVYYECCTDEDCSANSSCDGHTCTTPPPQPPPQNGNATANETGNQSENETGGQEEEQGEQESGCLAAFVLAVPAATLILEARRRRLPPRQQSFRQSR